MTEVNETKRFLSTTSRSITVVTNVFNEEENIHTFLENLKNQEYQGFEVLIVDDGSTDETIQIIKSHMSTLPLKLISLDHIGLKKARARGIEEVESKFFVVIDADIRFGSSCVGRFLESFDDPAVAAVSGILLSAGESRLSKASSIVSEGASKALTSRGGMKDLASGGFSAYRTEAVHQVGGFALEEVAADLDISWRMQSAGWKILAQNDIVGFHRDPDTIIGFLHWGFTRGQMGFYTRLRFKEKIGHWPQLVRFGPFAIIIATLLNWKIGTILLLASLISFMIFVRTTKADLWTKLLAFLIFFVKSLGWSVGFMVEAVQYISSLWRKQQ